MTCPIKSTACKSPKKTRSGFGSFRIALAISGIFLWQIAYTGDNSISIDSRVDKSKITIGDLITYTVEVTRSPEIKLKSPELAANLGAFEIRDYSVQEPKSEGGQIVDRVDYVISTFDVGEFEIPPLVYYYFFPGDTTRHELKTEEIRVVVESLKPSESGDIRDIKSPLALPKDYRKLIIWSSLAVALLVLLAISIYVWRRHKAGKGILPTKVEPPRPAHEIALEALEALQAGSLLADGEIKEYYVRMSDIIRRYIEGRYFIVALELTTFELIKDLRTADVDPQHVDLFQNFLDFCDLVKFAKLIPTASEHESILQQAFTVVENTKLVYDVHLDGKAEGEKESLPGELVEAQTMLEQDTSDPVEKIQDQT